MGEFLTELVNNTLTGIVTFINTLLSILPDSPFKAPIESISTSVGSEYLGYINYFLPVTEFLTILSVWVTAIVLYYVISVALRWAKAIS